MHFICGGKAKAKYSRLYATVSITTKRVGDKIEITVKDYGPGICRKNKRKDLSTFLHN
jgi:K+-sensing histidine kinase KdpD